jgi:nitrate reductase gamma subunit
MSELLHFAEHTLQEVALAFMALVYTLRLIWLFRRFKPGRDRQPQTGAPGTTPRKGILYSWGIIAMPWAMESTRRDLFLWLQFVFFHVGVVAAIALSFVIPYGPSLLSHDWVVKAFQGFVGLACLIGCYRIGRRLSSPVLRKISSPDDYFSVLLLTVWFASAFFAAPNQPQGGEGVLLTYFFLTAFFLVYVPFSKISHYLYYPITRYYFGKTMGHRGVFPLPRDAKASHR